MKRTYLFTINLNGAIDWNRIEIFVAERNGNILPRLMTEDYNEMGISSYFLVSHLLFTSIMISLSYSHFINNNNYKPNEFTI